MVLMSRQLEDTWNKASDAEKVTATTEARVLLGNLVHYPGRNGRVDGNDLAVAAATLLWFRNLVLGHLPDDRPAAQLQGALDTIKKSILDFQAEQPDNLALNSIVANLRERRLL